MTKKRKKLMLSDLSNTVKLQKMLPAQRENPALQNIKNSSTFLSCGSLLFPGFKFGSKFGAKFGSTDPQLNSDPEYVK
jgi:hypothetical protein